MRNPRMLGRLRYVVAAVAVAGAAAGAVQLAGPGGVAAQPAKPAKVSIGIVTFLSGAAAGPFGVPARNGAEILVEALNEGKVPAPYADKGIGGVPIETVFVDEAGGATRQVTELRNLIQRQQVDLVIGYISSGDCLAVAPVAEELKKLLVLFDCGTPRIFEDRAYRYVFRTAGHAVLDSVGAARYVLARKPGLKTIAGINQNYAWGQDSWNDFRAAMLALKPDVKEVSVQFPKLFAGQYGAEISALLGAGPEVVHSSFWGGDMEALILQGAPRGLFDKTQVLLTPGETVLARLGRRLPDGIMVGARGPHGPFAPDNELNRWLIAAYQDRYNTPPTYPVYHMAQAILGVKAAWEKAMKAAGGRWPTTDQVIAAFERLTFESPSGPIAMSLGNGHQAVESVAYGATKFDPATGRSRVVDVVRYGAACVNPPEGVKSLDWITSGFKGAKCP